MLRNDSITKVKRNRADIFIVSRRLSMTNYSLLSLIFQYSLRFCTQSVSLEIFFRVSFFKYKFEQMLQYLDGRSDMNEVNDHRVHMLLNDHTVYKLNDVALRGKQNKGLCLQNSFHQLSFSFRLLTLSLILLMILTHSSFLLSYWTSVRLLRLLSLKICLNLYR